MLVILRLRRQLNRLHAADLDAVEADGRAYLQTFDFGQIGDHAIFRPENSGAGDIKNRYRQDE